MQAIITATIAYPLGTESNRTVFRDIYVFVDRLKDIAATKGDQKVVESIRRHARAAELLTEYNQLMVAWNNIQLEFRLHIPEPTPSTTLEQFLGQVDSKANLWFELARLNQREQRSQNQQVDRRSTRPAPDSEDPPDQAGASKIETVDFLLARVRLTKRTKLQRNLLMTLPSLSRPRNSFPASASVNALTNSVEAKSDTPGNSAVEKSTVKESKVYPSIAAEASKSTSADASTCEEFIQSTASSIKEVGTGHTFRNYHYAMADAKLSPDREIFKPCLDTGYGVTLLDREYSRTIPDFQTRRIASPIKVRGVGSDVYETDEYGIIPTYFLGKRDSKEFTAVTAPREVYIIDNLKAKILIDRDFLFEPEEYELSLYTHLVDLSLTAVVAKNDSDYSVKIPRNLRLRTVQEANFDNCYYITSGQYNVAELATRRPKKEYQTSWIKRVFNKVATASAIAILAVLAATLIPTASISTEISVTPTLYDCVLANSITVYGDNPAIKAVIDEFPTLWQEGGFTDVP
ncbi:hypothetical protein OEA41_009794 [Lepraria neglecta]|uniref:Uncharacterized protein n=1 Tax=Lepraria neglecta TaxID=209136 RepID=A0AAD9YVC2_9LECA|nr:hypothetical protein OEA41_009794 [Lepraria neglecta]